MDHDALCERPVDDLIDHFEFIAGCDPSQPHPGIESNIIINNSIIASRPHHPVLRATIEQIAQGWVEAEKRFPGSDCENTFARILRRTLVPFISAARDGCCQSSNRTIILPASYFYSLGVVPENAFEEMKKEGFIYAVHMHDASHVR